MRQLQEEVERCRELVTTYELSITRKDQVIANITGAVQKQVHAWRLWLEGFEQQVTNQQVPSSLFMSGNFIYVMLRVNAAFVYEVMAG